MESEPEPWQELLVLLLLLDPIGLACDDFRPAGSTSSAKVGEEDKEALAIERGTND